MRFSDVPRCEKEKDIEGMKKLLMTLDIVKDAIKN
jgi:hypothetical protein